MSEPHAIQVREIVTALLKLPQKEQREFMRVALDYLRRESFTEVGSIYEFATSEPSAVLTESRRIELLGVVARSAREGDVSLLLPTV